MATIDKGMIAHPACFISKGIYQKYLYNTKYKSAADYDFILKIRNIAEFHFIEKIFANYRLGGKSDSYFCKLETIKVRRSYKFISIVEFVMRFIYYHVSDLYKKIAKYKRICCHP
jgi:hypothetical protein